MQRLPLRPLRALAAAARAGTLFAVIACSSNDSGQGDADPDEPGGTSHARDSGVEAGSVMTASDAAGATLPELCSGCAGEDREVGDNVAHFHHVHINTHDLAASEAFYERVFGAIDVRLNDQADVLKADGAFLLFHEVTEPPTDAVDTGLEHFGWGRLDLLAWWDEAQTKDVRLDQRSGALTGPFELFTDYYFLYLQGPSNERIEVETETAEFDQLKHVHFMTDDVNATVGFYETLLGVTAEMPEATELMLASEFDGMPIQWSSNTVIVDKVKMIFFGPPFFGSRRPSRRPTTIPSGTWPSHSPISSR